LPSLISLQQQFTLKGLSFDCFGLLLIFFFEISVSPIMRVAGLLFQYETSSAWIMRLPPPSTPVTCAEWQQPKRIEGIKKAEIVEGARLHKRKKIKTN
jgi:hypothetical protein